MTTALVAPQPEPFDVGAWWTRMQELFQAAFESVAAVFRRFVAAVLPVLRAAWRFLQRLAYRCYGPAPLCIDGHAYHRRIRGSRC